MHRPRLLWKLYASYLLIVLVCIAAVGVFVARSAHSFYTSHLESELEARAHLVEQQVAPLVAVDTATGLESLVRRLGEASGTRITIISAGPPTGSPGTVMADSDVAPGTMENHRDRPEVRRALGGGVGRSIRHSATLREDMMYVAVPLRVGGQTLAVVRTAVPLTVVNDALSSLYLRILLAALLAALAAALLGLYVSRRLVAELELVREGADRLASGDLEHTVRAPNTREIGGLADSLNAMARQLDEKIITITQQRNELQAVLSSMSEGVLAFDSEQRVISLNEEAARLLEVDAGEVRQRTIQEVVRNPGLQRFVADTLAGDEPVEADLVLHAGRLERYLQAHGTVLRDADGLGIGAVVVLNDVTRLRRLEQIRREFVANVSHEVRTPVTSIKGFAETLLDGAEDEEDRRRFLSIISSQADRLAALVDDLLSLSRLEREAEAPTLAVELGDLCAPLQVAVDVCDVKAAEKEVTLALDCSGNVRARFNQPLIERAVVNLIDNAVNYSERGGTVEVQGAVHDGEVVISVRDEGCGIEAEHLPRLFERFYRVDKARSRQMGGTGLGLAIVKHVAQVHDGWVTVQSTPGQGSTFEIHLPAS
ncbi:MAG TPA: ATP-binding protein [Thermoleophilia bacterium]|nr:ATP-binding protein [Thermoleophilia bacterium]